MDYFKGVLATIATLFLAVLIPMFWTTFRGLSSQKATGIAVFQPGYLKPSYRHRSGFLRCGYLCFFPFLAVSKIRR
jgi:hypothetical protein